MHIKSADIGKGVDFGRNGPCAIHHTPRKYMIVSMRSDGNASNSRNLRCRKQLKQLPRSKLFSGRPILRRPPLDRLRKVSVPALGRPGRSPFRILTTPMERRHRRAPDRRPRLHRAVRRRRCLLRLPLLNPPRLASAPRPQGMRLFPQIPIQHLHRQVPDHRHRLRRPNRITSPLPAQRHSPPQLRPVAQILMQR